MARPLRRRHHNREPRPGERPRRLLREGAEGRELRQDDPPTKHLDTTLSARRRDAERVAREMGVALGGPYILGTQEERGRPYNPTQLGKDFAASCEMNGFKCTFHDLRRAFATMMIAGGCDVRTVAGYLGHASVSVTLGIYADVDPDAKRAAVGKVADPLDVDLDSLYDFPRPESAGVGALTFSVEQLRAMLAAAEEREAGHGRLWARLAPRALALPRRLAVDVSALDRIASTVRGERLRTCPTKNLPRLRHQSLSQATRRSGT